MAHALTQSKTQTPTFSDNPAVVAQANSYAELTVDAIKVLRDWRKSLSAHELIDQDGAVKSDEDLSETRLEKREHIRLRLNAGQALEKPILGIGIFDNIEIGAGSDTLATLVLAGITVLPVHVRMSQLADFESFKAG